MKEVSNRVVNEDHRIGCRSWWERKKRKGESGIVTNLENVGLSLTGKGDIRG